MTLYKRKDLKSTYRWMDKETGEWMEKIVTSSPSGRTIKYLGEEIYHISGHVGENLTPRTLFTGEFVWGYVITWSDKEDYVWSSIEDAKAAIRSKLLAEGKLKAKTITVYERVDKDRYGNWY